jgi:autotransporter-associated beta strand protein
MCTFLKELKKILVNQTFAIVTLTMISSNVIIAQQNVFNRDNSNTGDWGSGNLPWFYQTSNNNQGDPDNNNTVRNDVFVGHNNFVIMSLNGRYYIHRDFTFQSAASTQRTLNNTTGGGFSFTRTLSNQANVTHIFNTPVAIDANNAVIQLENASGGALTFNGSVFTNNNQTFIRFLNGNTGTITLSGAMSQGGSFVKQNGGTLVFNGSAAFSGSIFIDEGTVRVGRNLTSNAIDIGGGVQLSTGFNATLEISNGGTDVSKAINVRNFGTGSGNRFITFSHPSATTATISGAVALEKVVTITNPNSNDGATISGVISGTGGIIKSGSGILALTASNSYNGTTTISNGEIRLNPTANATFASQIVLNGGTLSTTAIAATRTFTSSSTLNLNANSTIALGTGDHTLSFANSSSLTPWAGTTLTITGWQGAAGLPGTSGKLFVGSNATGLTPEQLAKITFTGYCTGAAQLPNGEVVPRAVLPTAFLSTTSNIVAGTNRIFDPANNCSALTAILPSGLDEVAGNVTTQVWVEATQPSNAQGRPFAKRHYEITPATNAANATSTITLYFLQSEFDDFNAFNPSGPDMPTGPSDVLGISNLRIYKYAGSSSPSNGLPGSYAGAGSLIDPADANIVWNATLNRWEVTFDVVGFSGFFVTNANFTILPLQLTSFTGSKQTTGNVLGWQTANEQNTKRFELERSANGGSFARIATIAAAGAGSHRYSHTDAATQHGTVWYRLKMIDADGKFSYSPVVIIQPNANNAIALFPNPAKNLVNIQVGNRTLLNTTAQVMDAKGALVQAIKLTGYNQQFNVAPLAKGMYLLKLADGTVLRFVKE